LGAARAGTGTQRDYPAGATANRQTQGANAMMLLFLIVGIAGAFVYYLELKNKKENEARFDLFVRQVQQSGELSEEEKREHIKNLYLLNGFNMIRQDSNSLTVSKKYFSLGAAMMWFGLLGIGVLVYLLYLPFKRPEVKIVFYK
jgi:hypothetical protein